MKGYLLKTTPNIKYASGLSLDFARIFNHQTSTNHFEICASMDNENLVTIKSELNKKAPQTSPAGLFIVLWPLVKCDGHIYFFIVTQNM